MHDPMQQMVVGYIGAAGLQWLKRQKWFPLVSNASATWVQRVFSALVATAAASGIAYSWDNTAGVLTITGLTAASLLHFGWDVIQQFVAQHLAYHVGVKGIDSGWNGIDQRAKPTGTN